MRNRNRRRQGPNLDISNCELAVAKHEYEGLAQFALNLVPASPPPAEYIDHVTVGGKERRTSLSVVPIPSGRLLSLQRPDRIQIGFRGKPHQRRGQEHKQHKPIREQTSEHI